jgi:DNA (cytosine-5)-methyltransferase 1
MLDTYNQQIQEEVSCTIRTNVNTANHHFVVMEEPKVINPLKGQSDNGWHFEQQVYDAEGIARAVKAGEGSGNIPKVIEVGRVKEGRHQQDFVQHEEGICRCICTGHHASTPHLLKTMVSEPISVAMRGRNPNNPSERGKSNGNYKQRLEMNENGTSNTLTSVQKDNLVVEPNVMTPKRTEFGKAIRKEYEAGAIDMSRHDMTTMEPRKDGVSNTLTSVQKDNLLCEPKFRIRKLTPRECFRLMGVEDKDIDTIQAAGISNSQQYKMAGNSIVVDVLFHIFRKMFIETGNESQQLTLF